MDGKFCVLDEIVNICVIIEFFLKLFMKG